MRRYPEDAWERAMKIQEVILRAMAKKLTWWPAAEILGMTDRSLRRWRWRWEPQGYDGLFDRRRGRPSPKRVPLPTGALGCTLPVGQKLKFWAKSKGTKRGQSVFAGALHCGDEPQVLAPGGGARARLRAGRAP